MSPFLSLPKVTVTNWPYYKSSFQCSYVLSLAGLPEDFCELVSKIYFTNRAQTALWDHGHHSSPQCLCQTQAAHAELASQQCLASTPSKHLCSLPFACPRELSCIWDFESTLLFSQHFNCTGETGQQAGPAAQPKTDGLGWAVCQLSQCHLVSKSPGCHLTLKVQ